MVKTLLIAGAAVVVVYLLTRQSGSGFSLTSPGYRAPAPNPQQAAKTGDANVWSFLSTATSSLGSYLSKTSSSSPTGAAAATTAPKYSDDLLTPSWV